MHRVEPTARLVLELPDLDIAAIRIGQRELEVAALDIAPRCAVDLPLTVLSLEAELASADCLARLQVHHRIGCRQHIGDRVVRQVGRLADDVERHDLVGVREVAVVRRAVVLQYDSATDRILREVDDHLVALRRTGPIATHRLRCRHQPAIRADDRQGLPGIEREVPRSGDRGTEDAEAVLSPLDLHDRPWATVDEDHIAPQSRVILEREQQRAVLVEQCIRQDQRHVVAAVRDGQRLLRGVGHVVLGDQPVVRVLGRVMDAVVVVPQRSGGLEVRVVVVLELPGVGDVTRVAVELRQRRRAVQVHRRPRLVAERRMNVWQRVDVSHDGSTTLIDLDGRARHRAVVGEEHRLESRHDLERRGSHRHAVVVGRGVAAYRDRDRWNAERSRERHRQLACRHAIGEHGLARHDLGQRQRQ